jgi:hypothetical protein
LYKKGGVQAKYLCAALQMKKRRLFLIIIGIGQIV